MGEVMHWSLKTNRFREKFEVSSQDGRQLVFLDCTQSGGDNITTTMHYSIDASKARELAEALVCAANYAETNYKKV